MQLAHAADDGLAALLVCADGEGRVFLCELCKSVAELVEVFLSLGLYGDTDNGIGEVHGLEGDGSTLVGEGVTGVNVLEADACADVACADAVNGVLVVGVHLEQTAHAFLLAGTDVVDVGASLHLAAIDAEEGQAAYVRIGCNLERECCCLLVLVWLTGLCLAGLGVDALDGGSVKR